MMYMNIQKRRFRVKHRINKYKGDMEFRLATPEDVPKIKKIHQYQDFYHPNMNEETRRNKYRKWKKAVKAARTF